MDRLKRLWRSLKNKICHACCRSAKAEANLELGYNCKLAFFERGLGSLTSDSSLEHPDRHLSCLAPPACKFRSRWRHHRQCLPQAGSQADPPQYLRLSCSCTTFRNPIDQTQQRQELLCVTILVVRDECSLIKFTCKRAVCRLHQCMLLSRDKHAWVQSSLSCLLKQCCIV